VDTSSGNVFVHVGPEGCDPVAIVVHTDEYFDCEERVDADAALIAAAPDLLEVAKDALRVIRGTDKVLHANGIMEGIDNPVIAPLVAAIAKATGQEGGAL